MVALCSDESFYMLKYNPDYDGEPDEVKFNVYNFQIKIIYFRMVMKMHLR